MFVKKSVNHKFAGVFMKWMVILVKVALGALQGLSCMAGLGARCVGLRLDWVGGRGGWSPLFTWDAINVNM